MKLSEWIDGLLAKGKIAFSIDDTKQLNDLTEVAIKRSLAKLYYHSSII